MAHGQPHALGGLVRRDTFHKNGRGGGRLPAYASRVPIFQSESVVAGPDDARSGIRIHPFQERLSGSTYVAVGVPQNGQSGLLERWVPRLVFPDLLKILQLIRQPVAEGDVAVVVLQLLGGGLQPGG